MKIKQLAPVATAMGIVAALAWGFWGCDDKGTGGGGIREDYYKVYFADIDHPYTYFALHPESGVVDSFTLPYPCDHGFAISPDGTIMYLNTGASIAHVNLDSLTVVEEHPVPHDRTSVVISPDGHYLALLGDGLDIFTLPDFGHIYCDSNTGEALAGTFSATSQTFYCIRRDEQRHYYIGVTRIGPTTTTARTYITLGSPRMVVPNENESKWFVFAFVRHDVFYFHVYDPARRQFTYSQVLIPGSGDMKLSPDGRFVIFTQPGQLNSDAVPPPYFTIFDARRDRIFREVSTTGYGPSYATAFIPSDLCVTPDGQWLVIAWPPGGGHLLTYNLLTLKMGQYIFVGSQRELVSLTCQLKT